MISLQQDRAGPDQTIKAGVMTVILNCPLSDDLKCFCSFVFDVFTLK